MFARLSGTLGLRVGLRWVPRWGTTSEGEGIVVDGRTRLVLPGEELVGTFLLIIEKGGETTNQDACL